MPYPPGICTKGMTIEVGTNVRRRLGIIILNEIGPDEEIVNKDAAVLYIRHSRPSEASISLRVVILPKGMKDCLDSCNDWQCKEPHSTR